MQDKHALDTAPHVVGRVVDRDDDVDAMRRLCSDHAARIRVHSRRARIHGSFSHQRALARYAMIRSCASISLLQPVAMRAQLRELLAKLAFSTRSLVDYLVPMLDHRLELARMPDEVAKLGVTSAQQPVEPHHLARLVVDAPQLGVVRIGEQRQCGECRRQRRGGARGDDDEIHRRGQRRFNRRGCVADRRFVTAAARLRTTVPNRDSVAGDASAERENAGRRDLRARRGRARAGGTDCT